FNAISQLPDESVANADHMEEIVLPAQVLGTKYVVLPPSAPNGTTVGHVVRIYGNVDGTMLTYPGIKPPGAPDVINAGEVYQIPPIGAGGLCAQAADHCMYNLPFVVEAQAEHAFAVNSFMVGGALQMTCTNDANNPCRGDPSASMMVAPEQFRKEYTFLAPVDYVDSYADVIITAGADITLDGAAQALLQTPIEGSEWAYVRIPLDKATGGVHTISTTHEAGLGLQVAGFGNATSLYYPGGMNLKLIAPPPEIPR
ncbi:MAG TPA: IgGFc-binding protein, partial [Polyangiaceae bacterium]|nr:IgGFc-binding protein [Polyangiaceae bacterium]